jgi:hypothetical protein
MENYGWAFDIKIGGKHNSSQKGRGNRIATKN